MTRLWRALCTSPDTHTHTLVLQQSSSRGHLGPINVSAQKVPGVSVFSVYSDPRQLRTNGPGVCLHENDFLSEWRLDFTQNK